MKLVLYAIAIFILLYTLAVLNGSHMHSDNLSGNGRAYQASSSSELKVNIGYEWARQRDIRSHARCRVQWTDESHEPYERTGCSKYVSEAKGLNNLPPIPKHAGWDDGTTTAKCSADMHAYWDPLLQDMLERGDDMAYSARQRELQDELRQCENFDHIRIGRVIHEPQLRLNLILERVKAGKALSEEDKLTVQRDYPGVWEFPRNEYRARYLNTVKEIFGIAGGKEEILSGNPIEDEVSQSRSNDETDPNNTQRVAGADEDQEQHDRLQALGVGMSKYEFRESQRRAFKKIEERTKQRNQESADRLTEHEYTAE